MSENGPPVAPSAMERAPEPPEASLPSPRELMREGWPYAAAGAATLAAFGGGVEAAIHLEGLKIHPSEEEYYTSQPGNTGAPPMEHANAVQVGTMALPPLVVAVAAGAWIAQRRQRRAVRAEG